SAPLGARRRLVEDHLLKRSLAPGPPDLEIGYPELLPQRLLDELAPGRVAGEKDRDALFAPVPRAAPGRDGEHVLHQLHAVPDPREQVILERDVEAWDIAPERREPHLAPVEAGGGERGARQAPRPARG